MGIINSIKFLFAKKYYSWKIKRVAAECGDNIYVGGKSYVTNKTFDFKKSWIIANSAKFNLIILTFYNKI